MYAAFAKRKLVEGLESRRDAMIAGLWGNPNFDGEDAGDARQRALREIDEQLDRAIEIVYGGEEHIDPDDPFFSAMSVPEVDQGTLAEVEETRRREELRLSDWPVDQE